MNRYSQTSALRPLAAALAFALGAVIAQAHPGHGIQDASTTHLLTSPYHLVVLAICGTSFLIVACFVQRRMPRRLLQAAGLVALAASTVLWGWGG
jgi:uncharacterized membrane protein